ncbi:RHS repeat-associated core domain-containing protein [Pseudomonas faucium]|uniref:RHS repeat-associated core domain-containing protein n=1 Tax=Pseudomonas faucium TaxID=2740518 RepID=UPI0039C3DDCF
MAKYPVSMPLTYKILGPCKQASICLVLQGQPISNSTFGVYGFAPRPLPSAIGFKGEYIDPLTDYYPLGNGSRSYSSSLMRFASPDDISPFGRGGLNAYCFVLGDPINFSDPDGHAPRFIPTVQRPYVGKAYRLHGGIYVFRVHNKRTNERMLNVHGHGAPGKIGERYYTADKLYLRLKQAGFNPDKQPINIFSCFSADARKNKNSLIQDMANLSKQPVLGFSGITVSRNTLIKQSDKNMYHISYGLHTVNPDVDKFPRFSYEPVIAQPQGKISNIRQA